MSVNITPTAPIVYINTSSQSKNVLLPSAAAYTGQSITIKDFTGQANTNPITVVRTGSDLIDKSTQIVINTPNGSLILKSLGFSWSVVGQVKDYAPIKKNSLVKYILPIYIASLSNNLLFNYLDLYFMTDSNLTTQWAPQTVYRLVILPSAYQNILTNVKFVFAAGSKKPTSVSVYTDSTKSTLVLQDNNPQFISDGQNAYYGKVVNTNIVSSKYYVEVPMSFQNNALQLKNLELEGSYTTRVFPILTSVNRNPTITNPTSNTLNNINDLYFYAETYVAWQVGNNLADVILTFKFSNAVSITGITINFYYPNSNGATAISVKSGDGTLLYNQSTSFDQYAGDPYPYSINILPVSTSTLTIQLQGQSSGILAINGISFTTIATNYSEVQKSPVLTISNIPNSLGSLSALTDGNISTYSYWSTSANFVNLTFTFSTVNLWTRVTIYFYNAQSQGPSSIQITTGEGIQLYNGSPTLSGSGYSAVQLSLQSISSDKIIIQMGVKSNGILLLTEIKFYCNKSILYLYDISDVDSNGSSSGNILDVINTSSTTYWTPYKIYKVLYNFSIYIATTFSGIRFYFASPSQSPTQIYIYKDTNKNELVYQNTNIVVDTSCNFIARFSASSILLYVEFYSDSSKSDISIAEVKFIKV
jgi:hypothetical protein